MKDGSGGVQMQNSREWTYAYAKHSDVEAFLRLGWLPHDSLDGCDHGQYAVLVEWLCDCQVPMPVHDTAFEGGRRRASGQRGWELRSVSIDV
jgi:hypothetical protein